MERPDLTWLGRTVTVTVDRSMGTYHPRHAGLYYPVNYGYVQGVTAPDGEEQDAYILGADAFSGAVLRRAGHPVTQAAPVLSDGGRSDR